MKNIIQLTYNEIQTIKGASNECGCVDNTGVITLCYAPSGVKCWELCCEDKGSISYQWLDNKASPCQLPQPSLCATISAYNPILWVLIMIFGNEVSSSAARKKSF